MRNTKMRSCPRARLKWTLLTLLAAGCSSGTGDTANQGSPQSLAGTATASDDAAAICSAEADACRVTCGRDRDCLTKCDAELAACLPVVPPPPDPCAGAYNACTTACGQQDRGAPNGGACFQACESQHSECQADAFCREYADNCLARSEREPGTEAEKQARCEQVYTDCRATWGQPPPPPAPDACSVAFDACQGECPASTQSGDRTAPSNPCLDACRTELAECNEAAFCQVRVDSCLAEGARSPLTPDELARRCEQVRTDCLRELQPPVDPCQEANATCRGQCSIGDRACLSACDAALAACQQPPADPCQEAIEACRRDCGIDDPECVRACDALRTPTGTCESPSGP